MPHKKPFLIRNPNKLGSSKENLPTTFDPDDVRTCFGSGCQNAPEFRMIHLDGEGTYDDGTRCDEGVGVALLCRGCAVEESRVNLGVMDGSIKASVPTLGFMLLPLHMSAERAEELRTEITPEVWTEPQSE